jgi:hypothetical protein
MVFEMAVLSLGVKPNNAIVDTIRENISNVKVIGDVKAPREIAQAIKEGYSESYHLEVKELVTNS